ncbi:MAG: hypothetical protein DRP52_01050 [Planctomycetota bacterium]|nr:MAG: hypothetical protein DRP52_01050 [Planctomycetota bacterium]RLC83035.1 MAG: hypothetical protein DRJ03_18110 [Chloroflexota bacterium]
MPAKKDEQPKKEMYLRIRIDAVSLGHTQRNTGDIVPVSDLDERRRGGLLAVIKAQENNYRVAEIGTLDEAGQFVPLKGPDAELVRSANEVKAYGRAAQELFANPEPAEA